MTRRSIFASIAYLLGLGAMAAVPVPKRIILPLTERDVRRIYDLLTKEVARLKELEQGDLTLGAEAAKLGPEYQELADDLLLRLEEE